MGAPSGAEQRGRKEGPWEDAAGATEEAVGAAKQ